MGMGMDTRMHFAIAYPAKARLTWRFPCRSGLMLVFLFVCLKGVVATSLSQDLDCGSAYLSKRSPNTEDAIRREFPHSIVRVSPAAFGPELLNYQSLSWSSQDRSLVGMRATR